MLDAMIVGLSSPNVERVDRPPPYEVKAVGKFGRDIYVSQADVRSQRPESESIENSGLHVYKPQTYGQYDSAAGLSVTINSGLAQKRENTPILGTNAAGLTRYKDRDHVGLYVGASSYAPTVTDARATTYTAATITAPQIDASIVKPGMVIDTEHEPAFVGIVTSVSGTTATTGGWYRAGSGAPATPPNSVSAVVNPNTKIWGANINVYLAPEGEATKAAGIELGLNAQKKGSGPNVWGYDAVTLGGEKPLAHFISRGARTTSFLASNSGGDFGFLSDTQGVGFEARDSAAYSYSAMTHGTRKWSVNATGSVSRKFESFRAVSSNYAIGEDDVFIAASGNGITLTLPSAKGAPGRTYTLRAIRTFSVVPTAGENIDGTPRKGVSQDSTLHVISDGANWLSY